MKKTKKNLWTYLNTPIKLGLRIFHETKYKNPTLVTDLSSDPETHKAFRINAESKISRGEKNLLWKLVEREEKGSSWA